MQSLVYPNLHHQILQVILVVGLVRVGVALPLVALLCGFSGFSTVESPRTAGVTDKPRPPPLSREQQIGIGTGGEEPWSVLRVALLGL